MDVLDMRNTNNVLAWLVVCSQSHSVLISRRGINFTRHSSAELRRYVFMSMLACVLAVYYLMKCSTFIEIWLPATSSFQQISLWRCPTSDTLATSNLRMEYTTGLSASTYQWSGMLSSPSVTECTQRRVMCECMYTYNLFRVDST